MFNKKRVALSAAILGAIALPAATGNWPDAKGMLFEYHYAVWNATAVIDDEETSVKRGITVDQLYAERVERCVAAGGNYVNCHGGRSYFDDDPYPSLGWKPRTFKATVHGLLAAAGTLVPFILSIIAGAIACAALAWFGPGLMSRYLRWLKRTD